MKTMSRKLKIALLTGYLLAAGLLSLGLTVEPVHAGGNPLGGDFAE